MLLKPQDLGIGHFPGWIYHFPQRRYRFRSVLHCLQRTDPGYTGQRRHDTGYRYRSADLLRSSRHRSASGHLRLPSNVPEKPLLPCIKTTTLPQNNRFKLFQIPIRSAGCPFGGSLFSWSSRSYPRREYAKSRSSPNGSDAASAFFAEIQK